MVAGSRATGPSVGIAVAVTSTTNDLAWADCRRSRSEAGVATTRRLLVPAMWCRGVAERDWE